MQQSAETSSKRIPLKWWRDDELVEHRRQLNLHKLLRAGSHSVWQWPHPTTPLTIDVTVTGKQMVIAVGGYRQVVPFTYETFLGGRRIRPRFSCPVCSQHCERLIDKDGTFMCRACTGFEHRCRHRNRRSPLSRIAMLRAKLDAARTRPLPWGLRCTNREKIIRQITVAKREVAESIDQLEREVHDANCSRD